MHDGLSGIRLVNKLEKLLKQMTGASGQSRTDDRRFTKSGRGFDRIGRFLASQFQPEFAWLGYQPPGQLRGNISRKSGKIQEKSSVNHLCHLFPSHHYFLFHH